MPVDQFAFRCQLHYRQLTPNTDRTANISLLKHQNGQVLQNISLTTQYQFLSHECYVQCWFWSYACLHMQNIIYALSTATSHYRCHIQAPRQPLEAGLVRQCVFMYFFFVILVISRLDFRDGVFLWLGQFLVIAYIALLFCNCIEISVTCKKSSVELRSEKHK